MHDSEPLAAQLAQILESKARHPLGRAACNALDRLGGISVHHALDAEIEVLGVFAENNEVDVLIARCNTGIVLDRPDGGVEAEFLAQADRHARIHAVADTHGVRVTERRLGRPFERELAALDHVNYRLR